MLNEISEQNKTSQEVYSPVLAAYTDFRSYLKDFYNYKRASQKNSIRPYSYAHFSAAANIKSPNYLKLIIEGQRNLSPESMKKFAKALQLNKEETEEFAVLVKYGQSQDPLERNRYLRDLAEIRVKQKIKAGEISKEVWKNVPTWVTWALYALVDQKNADFDLNNLRDQLKGRANKDEIKKALAYLVDTGTLIDNGEGGYKKGRHSIPAPDDIPPALVRKLQAELIYLGMESLFEGNPKDREFGSFTMSLTEDEFEKLKFELRHLRKRIMKDAMVQREQMPGDRVFQLNIQLFPVTQQK